MQIRRQGPESRIRALGGNCFNTPFACSMVVAPASRSSVITRPWKVPAVRSTRPFAQGDRKNIISVPSSAASTVYRLLPWPLGARDSVRVLWSIPRQRQIRPSLAGRPLPSTQRGDPRPGTELTRLTRTASPTLVSIFGVGPDTAATLLVTAGSNPERLRSEASFAALCG